MMTVMRVSTLAASLRWITPNADEEIGYIARVSNPKAQPDDPVERLIKYLVLHKHWSPFEMACACVEIITTRDIARQILRHRSFHFQEFSQRYSEVLEEPVFSEARLQDTKNRQNSIVVEDEALSKEWTLLQNTVWDFCWNVYQLALKLGIAKELARKVLPEGLTRTKMYMQGTIRDWLFYLSIRMGPETQYEHRVVAREIGRLLKSHCPITFQAAAQAGIIDFVEDDGQST